MKSHLKRLNRSSYVLSILISMFLFVGLGLAIDSIFKAIFAIEVVDDGPTPLLVVFIVGWWVYAIYSSVCRLHDLDMSGWWILGALVPLLNVYIGLKLLFSKGSQQQNEYGQPAEGLNILGLKLKS